MGRLPRAAYRSQPRSHHRHSACAAPSMQFTCTVAAGCTFSCARSSDLAVHMRKHAHERPFVCPDGCGFSSKFSSALSRHKRMMHGGAARQVCGQGGCDYVAPKNWDLVEHRKRMHADGGPMLCRICDFETASHASMISHVRKHNGHKSYGARRYNADGRVSKGNNL